VRPCNHLGNIRIGLQDMKFDVVACIHFIHDKANSCEHSSHFQLQEELVYRN